MSFRPINWMLRITPRSYSMTSSASSRNGSGMVSPIVIRSPRRRGRAGSAGGKIEHPCGLKVDDKLEPSRLQHRQISWLSALEDATRVDANLAIRIRKIGPVAHQSASFGILTHRIRRWNRVSYCQHGKLNAPAVEEAVTADEKGIGPLAHGACIGRIDLANSTGVEDMDLQTTRNAQH